MTRDELLKKYNEGRRDFSGSDLRNAILSHAYLRNAILSNANLSGVDFSRADLSNSYLSHAYLRNAILSNANLSWVNLSDACLSYANFSGANFSGADLSYADLSNANLSGANLSGAKINDVVIKNIRVFTYLYKYQVWAIIAEDDSEWVRMGCFFRKREDWENDFWNNDNEFPNDNSEDSNMRLAAFQFACKWIDEIKHIMEKTKWKINLEHQG